MRALDRHTIEGWGIPAEVLMESAGREVVRLVLSVRRPGELVHVVCGRGNNGGDGLVIARQLKLLGVPVFASLAGAPGEDAAVQRARARAVGVDVADTLEPPLRGVATEGVVVDALFGTGLARPLTGALAQWVEQLNFLRGASGGRVRVVAVDIPSGIHTDTGQVQGTAVEADLTVALGLPKPGHLLEPGRSHAGGIEVARIGIADTAPDPQDAPDGDGGTSRTLTRHVSTWTQTGAATALPERPRSGHKGSFGHALIVAGSQGKTGAAILASEAAGRTGAGLVTLACPAGVHEVCEEKTLEAMTEPLPDLDGSVFAAAAEEGVVSLARTRDAVGLGPGIGRGEETLAWVRAVSKRIESPLALDADALFAFAGDLEPLRGRPGATVLTPHPGEAGALLDLSAATINEDRLGAARELAARTGAVVVLKGAGTVIASPDEYERINPTGGPALATGGTGDVLLGAITALLAQGVGVFDAACLGVYLHGAAADRWSRQFGDAGLQARDLLEGLPAAIAELRERSVPGFSFQEEDHALAMGFPDS
ncbi:MAG: NAD(P)H-hydrate dehydratase [Myxococcota bacterium]